MSVTPEEFPAGTRVVGDRDTWYGREGDYNYRVERAS